MGYKQDPATGTWEAYYSTRHPITKIPKTLKRIGLKSAAEAKRVEADLICRINKGFEPVPPGVTLYANLLVLFQSSLVERDLSKLTIDNYMTCLRLHTKVFYCFCASKRVVSTTQYPKSKILWWRQENGFNETASGTYERSS